MTLTDTPEVKYMLNAGAEGDAISVNPSADPPDPIDERDEV
jgi:hypothetical protein